MSRGTTNVFAEKGVKPLTIEPPRAFATVLQSVGARPTQTLAIGDTPSREQASSTLVSDIQSGIVGTPHHFFGRALHHGSLPFLHYRHSLITVSPALIILIGISSLLAVTNFESLSVAFGFVAALLSLYAMHVVGHIFAGRFVGSESDSLIISILGVTDPGLAFRERPIFHVPEVFETQDGVYLHGASPKVLQESAKQLREQVESSRLAGRSPSEMLLATSQEFAREFSHIIRAPMRSIGASIGSLVSLLLLRSLELEKVFSDAPFLLTGMLFVAAMLVVTPFLPPHRLGGAFPIQLKSFAYPLLVFSFIFLIMPWESQQALIIDFVDSSILLIFAILVIGRKLWWTHLVTIAKLAQQTSVASATIPIETLVTIGYGESLRSAQQKCLQSEQEFFPVLSGNQLRGVISRADIMKSQRPDFDREQMGSLIVHGLSLCDAHLALEACFSPKLEMPFFVVDQESVVGMVTTRSLRDALFLSLQEQIQHQESDFDE
ncbi:MAG: hypothetical protein ACO3XO_01815 [Bdellovibrionota bacterium]